MAHLDDILNFANNSEVATIVTIRTTYVNDAFTKLCGFHEDDVIGKKPGDFLRGENGHG